MKKNRKINNQWRIAGKVVFSVLGGLILCFTVQGQSKLGTTGNTIQNGQLVVEYAVGELSISTISAGNQIVTQGLIQPDPVIDCSKISFTTQPDSFFYTRGLVSLSINPLSNDGVFSAIDISIDKNQPEGNLTPAAPGSNWLLEIPADYPGSSAVFQYKVCSNICKSVCDSNVIKVRVSGYIPRAISPNGDGKNESFDPVKIIEESGLIVNLKRSKLSVYERSGEAIAILNPYPSGGWKMENISSSLPNGTYYYILDVVFDDNTTSQVRGAIQLVR